MRILIYRTFPDILNIDGYNVQEIGLAKALVRLGHSCDIVFYNGKNKDRAETCVFTYNGRELTYRIYWLHGFHVLKNGFMPSAKKLFENYDVIQVHEYEQISSWKAYCAQIKPTIVYHGLYHSAYTKGYNLKCFAFDNLFFRWKKRSGIYRNVVCLTKSEPAVDFLRSKGFEKVRSVGVGLDAEKFGEQYSVQRTGNSVLRLLYVGKIEDRRNSLFLLDVFDELLIRGLNVELRVIGSGEEPYLDGFMEKAKPFLESGRLVYTKKASQSEMPEEYGKADLFLFPSRYEIFGMVLLEAMYFGLPVVSSYNGGSSVLIDDKGENGVVLRDFTVKSWADTIENLLKDEALRQKISDRAAATIRESFLWDALAPEFVEAYKEAICSHSQF